MSFSKQLIKFSKAFYPETTRKTFVAFAPMAFRAVWSMVSPLLSDHQKAKFEFLNKKKSGQYSTYQKYIDKDNLSKDYGGNLDIQYSYQWECEQWNETKGYQNIL